MIKIDMNLAREITRQRIREERMPHLLALDVKFQRALESGSDSSSIVAAKQRLRDLPDQVANCRTPEELSALRKTVAQAAQV